MAEPTKLAARLKTAREAAGLRKVDVARKTGLSISYISHLEGGKRQARLSKAAAIALANLLRVRVEWLEAGTGAMRPPLSGLEGLSLAVRELPPARTWQAALEPLLAGSPLAGRTLPRLELTGGEAQDRAWGDLPEDMKEAIRRTLRQLASAATIIDTALPRDRADAVNQELALQIVSYIDEALGQA